MDRLEFLKYEYLTLREEIKETKGRIFKLAGLGIVGMPAAYFLARAYKLEILILSLPVLIMVVVLLYLAESRALMRCGRYIKTRIETEIKDSSEKPVGGWEHWLEEKGEGEHGRRTVDIFVAVFFYSLFVFYYIASVSLATQMAESSYALVGKAIVLGLYSGIGIVFIVFLYINFKHAIRT